MNLGSGNLSERTFQMIDTVRAVSEEIGCTLSQVAIAWTMLHPGVTSPIIGVRTPEQLLDNLGALDITLSAEQVERLDAASAIEDVFPYKFFNSPAQDFMFGGVKVERRGAERLQRVP